MKISAKLAISLKHKISFAEFLDVLLDNRVTSSLTSLKKKQTYTHFVDEAKIIWKSFEFIFFDFLLKALCHQTIFKNALEKFNLF